MKKGMLYVLLSLVVAIGMIFGIYNYSNTNVESSKEALNSTAVNKVVKKAQKRRTRGNCKKSVDVVVEADGVKRTAALRRSYASYVLTKNLPDKYHFIQEDNPLLRSKEKVSIPSVATAEYGVKRDAKYGEIGYDVKKEQLLIFEKDQTYKSGFYELGEFYSNQLVRAASNRDGVIEVKISLKK